MSVVIECLEEKINSIQNEQLVRKVDREEVKTAIFYMKPDKSLGSDDMSPGFYQAFLGHSGNRYSEIL